MIVRAFAILVTLAGATFGLALIIAEPDTLSAVAGKLGEGGMWTALAAFVLGAFVLGCWPRDAAGRLRLPLRR